MGVHHFRLLRGTDAASVASPTTIPVVGTRMNLVFQVIINSLWYYTCNIYLVWQIVVEDCGKAIYVVDDNNSTLPW